MRADVRKYFKENALDSTDALLFTIANVAESGNQGGDDASEVIVISKRTKFAILMYMIVCIAVVTVVQLKLSTEKATMVGFLMLVALAVALIVYL